MTAQGREVAGKFYLELEIFIRIIVLHLTETITFRLNLIELLDYSPTDCANVNYFPSSFSSFSNTVKMSLPASFLDALRTGAAIDEALLGSERFRTRSTAFFDG